MTPWTAAHQASLSFSTSQSLLKFMSIELVMPSDHLIICRPLLVLPSIFPSIRVFSNESAFHTTWPTYRSFSISPSSEYSGLISLWDRANNANPIHFTGFGLSNMIKPEQALKSIQPFSIIFAEHLFYARHWGSKAE